MRQPYVGADVHYAAVRRDGTIGCQAAIVVDAYDGSGSVELTVFPGGGQVEAQHARPGPVAPDGVPCDCTAHPQFTWHWPVVP